MLTKTHLAVIRAALKFFDEELGPHGIDAMRPYFDEEPTGKCTSREIRDLREFVENSKLRYASYSPASGQLTGSVLFRSPKAARASAMDLTCQVVTVLLSPQA